jgi:hypothetical protein
MTDFNLIVCIKGSPPVATSRRQTLQKSTRFGDRHAEALQDIGIPIEHPVSLNLNGPPFPPSARAKSAKLDVAVRYNLLVGGRGLAISHNRD